MKIAYFDCFSGISGDMILGSLVDAGLEVSALQRAVGKLKLPGCLLEARRVRRGGLSATKVDVINAKALPPYQSFSAIQHLLRKSLLHQDIKETAIEIFNRLAKAEAECHGKRINRTHLHEVGAIDTVVDVVGAVAGLSLLKVEKVFASPVHVGTGQVETAAGTFPIPAPATAVLLKGSPVYSTGAPGELTTPTGAAIITTLASAFIPLPAMTIEKIGAGAGKAERTIPNLLRLFLGVQTAAYTEDEIVQIETNIDDMNPQIYEHVFDILFSAGALDVFLTPIIMKRGRPAILITVLSSLSLSEKLTNLLFRETTTLGVRIKKIGRKILRRKITNKNTLYGSIQVKTAYQNGKPIRKKAEYRDVRRVADEKGKPLYPLMEEINRML